jgi:hypothetical protein
MIGVIGMRFAVGLRNSLRKLASFVCVHRISFVHIQIDES